MLLARIGGGAVARRQRRNGNAKNISSISGMARDAGSIEIRRRGVSKWHGGMKIRRSAGGGGGSALRKLAAWRA